MSIRQDTMILTNDQKACVEYDSGDLLIKGIPGAGKSVVLLRRALKLYNKNEGNKIAIFTYANTLVKYTDDIVNEILAKEDAIKISTIDKYCFDLYKILSGKQPYMIKKKEQDDCIKFAIENHRNKSSNKKHRLYSLDIEFWAEEFKWMKEKMLLTSKEYCESDRSGRGGKVRMSTADKKIAFEMLEEYNKNLVSRKKLDWQDPAIYIIQNKERIPENMKFDYVFVDEAQDLSYVKLCVAKTITKKAITVAADQAQKIYNTTFSWKEIGINVLGRGTKSLNKSFRSTKQIILLADDLLKKNKSSLMSQQEYIEPIIPDVEGPIPVILQCSNQTFEKKNLCELILEYQNENKNQTIAVIYKDKKEKYIISKWLQEYSIQPQIIEGQEGWSLMQPGVKLVTYHSAKGLEFDTVFIPRVVEDIIPRVPSDCDDAQIDELLERERSLLYVAMTRAKHRLIMLFSGEKSRFINEMNTELYEFIR